jgi:hypothetical protein
MHALLHSPDGSSELNLHGARTLARLLRNAVDTYQARVVASVGQSRTRPRDRHALVCSFRLKSAGFSEAMSASVPI